MTDVLAALRWLLVLELAGLAGLPLARRLFRRLPGAGYAFARPLGLILGAYLLWILGVLQVLDVSAVSWLFCLALVFAVGWGIGGRPRLKVGERRAALAVEVVFIVAFLAAVVVRAYNPRIEGTEKPMEFAFLNAILRGGSVPPHDPWLSGYAISYYYLGYLLMAALARLAAVGAGTAFNLGIATLFALTVTGAFAIVRGLVSLSGKERSDRPAPTFFGGLAAMALAVMGNLAGFLEVLHSRGLGSAAFWRWLDIKDLLEAPVPGPWLPDRYLWWWRASRVINDRSPLGDPIEVIDEFPFFSFLLGDMHPHVLALPFVLLAIAISVEWALRLRARPILGQHRQFLVVAALAIGSLGFLNTWDWPIYLVLFAGATWIGLRDSGQVRWTRLVIPPLVLAAGALLAYFPFYLSFQSQASGVLPTLFVHTKLRQFLVMFGPFLFVAGAFALYSLWTHHRSATKTAVVSWAVLMLGPFLFLGFVALVTLALPQGREALGQLRGTNEVRQLLGEASSWPRLIAHLFIEKATSPWMLLVVTGIASAAVAVIWERRRPSEDGDPIADGRAGVAGDMALLMIAVGLVLTWAVEFVYLRDYFNVRMNTVFKFYYQAWILLALGSGFGAFFLWKRLRGVARFGFVLVSAALMLMGLVYPPLALWEKTGGFATSPTLDGTRYLAQSQPAEYQAIQWLQAHVVGTPVIAEASGGSYSPFGRVSSHTGLPTILGWDFHEVQWRGTGRFNERGEEVERLYTTGSWEEAEEILRRYDVQLVYVGSLERQAYGPDAGRLLALNLPVLFTAGSGEDLVTIYAAPPEPVSSAEDQ